LAGKVGKQSEWATTLIRAVAYLEPDSGRGGGLISPEAAGPLTWQTRVFRVFVGQKHVDQCFDRQGNG
jgi:hypothetical protein